MFRHEGVIMEMGIGPVHPVNFLRLPRPQVFIGVQTPYALKESLFAQHLMNPCNAPAKSVGGIKKRRVRVRYFHAAAQ